MAVRGRTSSRILFHMSSVGTTDNHMSWDMPRRARTRVRDTNTKEALNSRLGQGSKLQG
jgi:hypothetical protein